MATNTHTISDIYIKESDLTFTDFQSRFNEQGSPGYDNWRVMISGEKEYDHAAIRGVITTLGGSVPSFIQLQMQVDVPDVFDRGSVVCSAAGVVTVPFNRSFYAVNEVVASMKGGAVVAVPRISNITTTSFDIELINTSNARVAGTCSWAAKGY
jgi:hypothetical protein